MDLVKLIYFDFQLQHHTKEGNQGTITAVVD
jgi:hypothetical protein